MRMKATKVMKRNHHQRMRKTWVKVCLTWPPIETGVVIWGDQDDNWVIALPNNYEMWNVWCGSKRYLIIDVVQGENTDCIDVLLDARTAPSPVVARGCMKIIIIMEQEDGFDNQNCYCHFTYSWESVAHWVFSPGHPLLLVREQVVLPHLDYNHHKHDTCIIIISY